MNRHFTEEYPTMEALFHSPFHAPISPPSHPHSQGYFNFFLFIVDFLKFHQLNLDTFFKKNVEKEV